MVGITDEPDSDYDLLTVILIRRGGGDSSVAVLDYLNGIFASDIDKINSYVDIKDKEIVLEGVKKMSGLGMIIYNQLLFMSVYIVSQMYFTLIVGLEP